MTASSRGNYENYLDFRRTEPSNFLWVSRRISPQIAYKQGVPRPTPNSHKAAVLKSPRIQELLDELSRTQNVSKSELETKVREILDEIGYNRNLKTTRWLGLLLTKISLRVSSGIHVNVDNIEKLKRRMGGSPVILVPSHRSYADFILMSCVCFTYDIEIPAIAAGMDFHGMWGMGTMLRDTGAFFMRRSYNDDSLYWTTFKQYIYQIVTKGDLPIEFFIEGTRSRSNKSLSPKYGLIAMVLKAFFLAQVPDILFVPINISYDRVLEEGLFAFELLGVPKPKESTSGFFKSLKIVKEKFGNIYFHFDEPISARDFFGDRLDRSGHSISPIHQQEITENQKALIPSLAHEIVRRQQKCSVINVFNLIAVVLNNNFSDRREPLSLSNLTEEVRWLKTTMEVFGGLVHTDNLERSIEEAFVVHGNLVEMKNGEVNLVRNTVTLDKIHPSKLKAHSLSEKTMTYSVPFVMLQIYVNPTLHYLVDAAFLVFIVSSHDGLGRDELHNHYHFLKSLFSLEFVGYAPRENTDFETSLQQTEAQRLVEITTDNRYRLGDNKKLQGLLFTSFKPFLLSYLVVSTVLQNVPLLCDEKTILVNVQKVLEASIDDKKQFVHPYCLNLDTLLNCLNNLYLMKAVEKSRRNNTNMYKTDQEKILAIKNKLELYIPSWYMQENLSEAPFWLNKL